MLFKRNDIKKRVAQNGNKTMTFIFCWDALYCSFDFLSTFSSHSGFDFHKTWKSDELFLRKPSILSLRIPQRFFWKSSISNTVISISQNFK